MALVVEDGSNKSDANSYVSTSYADGYHSDRGNTAWANATTDEKEQALIKATAYLDDRYYHRWKGWKQTDDQALEWPRYEVYDRSGWPIQEIPAKLKDATCEAALRALSAELEPDQTRGGKVKSRTVGPITTEYMDNAPSGTVYRKIDQLLRGLLQPAGQPRITRG
jgi:hypothetical protein